MMIGFIGCGNMGKAMLKGMIESGWNRDELFVCTHSPENAFKIASDFGITAEENNSSLVGKTDIIVLATKPNVYVEILEEVKDALSAGKIVIGLAPAFSIEKISENVRKGVKIARAMPNTPAMVGSGVTGICFTGDIVQNEKEEILKIFRSFGECYIVSESLMPAVGSVSGSSPAFVYMFIEAMAQAAVELGMKPYDAYNFAARAVEGSAKMVLETGELPAKLRDNVCSAGGTTIAGVNELEENGFKGNVISALKASANRFLELQA